MQKNPRPEIKTRVLDEVVPRLGELGFNYHTLCDFVRAGWCVEAPTVADIPDRKHWQILYEDKVTPYSGYESESGVSNAHPVWKLWVFNDRDLWSQVVQAYYEDANDMTSPTNTRTYGGGPMKLVFLECSGRVIPHISVSLAMDPLG